MKILFALLLLSVPAVGQFSFGVIGGVPFVKATTHTVDTADRYTIGPTAQFSLPLAGLRVEADALYRPVAFQTLPVFTTPGALPIRSSASQWRFPVLLQYKLSAPFVKPYVEGGYSYDHLNIKSNTNVLSTVPISPALTSLSSRHGFVLGAGVDFKVPFVRVSPVLRYTRDVSSGLSAVQQLNQVELLVGIRF